MRKLRLLASVLCASSFLCANSQSLYKVSMDQKLSHSSLVVEGRVVGQKSFWNDAHTMIYTSNQVEIYKIFKGSLQTSTIEVMTQGGSVGTEAIVASDLLHLEAEQTGIFFCYPNTIGLRSRENGSVLYDVYSSSQGFLRYDPSNARASAPFASYDDVKDVLYPELVAKTGNQARVVNADFTVRSARDLRPLAVSVTGFSPSTVNAGALLDPTTNVLTITGTGFGTASGSAAVFFDDVDDGSGGNMVGVAYNSPYMISWSSTSIQVRVPPSAGTGQVTVRDNAGLTGTAPGNLSVLYAIQAITVQDPSTLIVYAKESNLQNDNGAGGYTIQYSNSTAGSGVDITGSPALATFRRALTTWKEAAGFNVVEGANTSSQAISASDGLNVVMFDNTNTGVAPLADGVLAVCYSRYGICPNNYAANQAIKSEFDIVIRNAGVSTGTTTFTLGPCPPNASDFNEIDLETVILHELGHAIGLNHINDSYQANTSPANVGQINPGKLMNFAVLNSVKRTSPDYSALAGALYLTAQQGNTYGTCGISEMTQLSRTVESKDDCPASFPTTPTPQNTTVAFDLVHATSNRLVDPSYLQVRCDGNGAAVTNNAFYAFRTNAAGGTVLLSVSGYGTTPSTQTTCPQIYGGVPVTGVRLAIYQANSCPTAGSYPTPVACRTITANGALSAITGLAANTRYLIMVEGIENTKASFNLVFTGGALPIRLSDFSGTVADKFNNLQWKAEAIQDVSKMFVQKSADGSSFEDLAEIRNISEMMNGSVKDFVPFQKTFYRLKVVNNDGSLDYSSIVMLTRTKASIVHVYPNPVKTLINIQVNNAQRESFDVKLFSASGQMVARKTLVPTASQVTIPVESLPNGVYELSIYRGDTKVESQKIVLNR